MDIQKVPRKQINPAPETVLRIEYVDLASLVRWPRNPRKHDDPAILASVREFGFRDPIGVNLTTNEIEEGHGRLDCLLAIKEHGEPAPPFVEDREGSWFVPTLPFTDDRQTQERYALAHNRTQELGGNDDRGLASLLSDLSEQNALEGTGYDQEDLDEILQGMEKPDGPTPMKILPNVNMVWVFAGIPLEQYSKANIHIEALSQIPGVCLEQTAR